MSGSGASGGSTPRDAIVVGDSSDSEEESVAAVPAGKAEQLVDDHGLGYGREKAGRDGLGSEDSLDLGFGDGFGFGFDGEEDGGVMDELERVLAAKGW